MADASPSSAVALQPEGTISRLKEQDNQQLFKGLIFQGAQLPLMDRIYTW